MKKNIDQKVLLSCVCHGFHFVEILKDEDFGLIITHIERPKGIRQRLESAYNALFTNNDIFDGDLIVNQEDYKRLAKILAVKS